MENHITNTHTKTMLDRTILYTLQLPPRTSTPPTPRPRPRERPRSLPRRVLRDEFYDAETAAIFRESLTDDEKNAIQRNSQIREHEYLRQKWGRMVMDMTYADLCDYYALQSQRERNEWIRGYMQEQP